MTKTKKLFWDIIKPFFSDIGASRVKYILTEDDKIVDDDQIMSSTFDDFFSNIVLNLNILQNKDPSVNLNINVPLENLREKYKNYPTILAILQQRFWKLFSFRIILKEKIEKKIMTHNDTKASQQLDILRK